MIKAVASSRGWKHDTHASLYRVIDRLVAETGNSGFYRRFAAANALHFNSCETWGATDYVAGGLRDVRDLLDRLEPLLDHQVTHPLPAT